MFPADEVTYRLTVNKKGCKVKNGFQEQELSAINYYLIKLIKQKGELH